MQSPEGSKVIPRGTSSCARWLETGTKIEAAKDLLAEAKGLLVAAAAQADAGATQLAAHQRLQRQKLTQSMQEAVQQLARVADLRVKARPGRRDTASYQISTLPCLAAGVVFAEELRTSS